MEIAFKSGALDDIGYWKNSGKLSIQNRIDKLLKSIGLNPEKGIGKPEKLKGNLSGFWSRRINREHRIIYQIDHLKQIVTIYSLYGHYEKK